MKKIKFNMSASSLNLYYTSPLWFYYEKIVNAAPDSSVKTVYGKAGNVVHTTIENWIKDTSVDLEKEFETQWLRYKIEELKKTDRVNLNKELYRNSAKIGVFKLKTIYEKYSKQSELEIILPFINTDRAEIKLKGYIDVVFKLGDDVILLDWKTSSQVDEGDGFRRQGLMYFLLYYLKYNVIPTKIIFEYVKINKIKEYKFSKAQILAFYDEIKTLCNDIIYKKGYDINKYDIGSWDNMFNVHWNKCREQMNLRKTLYCNNVISIKIKNNRLYFNDNLPAKLKKSLLKKYKYKVQGCEFSPKFKAGLWDGYKNMYSFNSLPLGFIHDFKKFIDDYNVYFKTCYKLIFEDCRDALVLDKVYNTIFKKNDMKLRPYQTDAIDTLYAKKIGIMHMATGLGKTYTAAELIKKVNKRTLFLVNRLELIEQTHEEFTQLLGVNIGKMSEGNLDIANQITVGCIQTIYAILKGKDSDKKKQLMNYLYNVNLTIWDECHGIGNSEYYNILRKCIVNSEYIFGLTGTPFRNAGDTYEMNAIVGFPEVNYDTCYGEKHGYLCPTKTYFIHYKPNVYMPNKIIGSYTDIYNEDIVENEKRNALAIDVVRLFLKAHKKILILTKIIDHGVEFQKQLMMQGIDSYLINSKVNLTARKNMMKDFKRGKGEVMIAGIKIAGTGLNIVDLDCIINLSGNKSIIDSGQIIGRVKRIYPGKEYGYYIDFVDEGYFKSSSLERIKDLKFFGNDVVHIDNLKKIELK